MSLASLAILILSTLITVYCTVLYNGTTSRFLNSILFESKEEGMKGTKNFVDKMIHEETKTKLVSRVGAFKSIRYIVTLIRTHSSN